MLTLSADQSEVKAGGTILLTAVLAHSGPEQGEYTLSIRGVDTAWVTFYPPTLSVAAGGQATATILVAPPVNAAAADLALTVRAASAATNAEAEATFSVRLTSTTGAAAGRARRTGRLTWPRLLLLSAGVVVVVAAVGIFFLLHRHSSPPPQPTAACASQPTQLVDLYSDDTTTAIRISDPDLADVRILRTEPSDTLSPLFSSLLSLSPDGSHLAYVTAGNEALDDAHLWSLDVANPAQRQELAVIPHGLWQVRPAWSSDNHQVAFLRLNEQQAAASQTQLELWVAQVGGQPHKVAAPPELRPDGFYGSTAQPLCWAQDNQSVIFSSVTRDASPTDQGARATGSAQPADNLNPGAPQQMAVNVQTGATEQLATTAAAADSAPTTPAEPAGGAGCGLPVFSQNDPAWRNIIMQSSGDTIGKFGCAVTATAMLLNYYGSTMTPAQLNTCLGANADLIQWSSVVPCANGGVTASNAFDFAWPSLDQVLASGNPAIVGMVRGQTGLHFVVVTAGGGGDATSYAVIDPWDGTTTKTLQTFLDAGYNLRWIRTYTGTDKACPRLVAPQTPAADASGIAPVPDGPLLVPSQVLPFFAKVADQTGVPRELLLAIARIESGFTPRAVGPPIEKFSGTEDAHALGMMQFLPSTYRSYSAQVDDARAKAASTAGTFHALSLHADTPAVTPLGDAGIWDPEASIWAAAFFLQQHGVATDPQGAVFAYNNSKPYVDLVLKTAQQFKTSTIPDPNQFDPNGTSKPGTLAAPNPINPPPLSAAAAAAAVPPSVKQATATAQAKAAAPGASSGGGAPGAGGGANGGTPGGANGASGGTGSASGGSAAGVSGAVPIKWSVPEGSISRTAVLLTFNSTDAIGQIVNLSLHTLTLPGSTASPINQSTPSRPLTPGMVITDDGVYEAVAVTRQNGETRTSRRKFTIDRTAPTLDLSVVSAGTSTTTPTAGASQAVTTADAQHPVGDGAIRLKIGYADTLSGVASVEYRIDGGDWQLYFNAVAFKGDALIDIPGDHTVTVRATDVAGNVSQERSLDFTVKADPNKPFLDSGQPLLKPVSSLASSAVATTVAVVSSPTAVTTAAVTVAATAVATVAVTPTAQPTVAGTPAGTSQVGTATLQPPTITPANRLAPPGLSAAVTNVTPTATAGVTATVATTPTVAVTPTSAPTVTPTATAVTATPKISPTPLTLTTTPTTTVTTTVTVTTTPSPALKLTGPTCSDAAVRSISSCTAVTITNTGATDLRINNINTTGEFLIGDAGSTCTTALAPTAACNIPILFIPTTIGKRSGSLTITDSTPDSPHTIALTGNGVGAPAVAFAPPQFTCPDTLLGKTSQCSITLTNTGSAALTIASGIVVTGDFSPDPKGLDCGLTLGVSAHCTLSVIFAPTVHGIRTGVMTVTDSAPGSPHPISITGKGLAPGVTLSAGVAIAPSSIVCPDTVVGDPPKPCLPSEQQLTLTNSGDGELDVSSIIPLDDFIKIGDTTSCATLQAQKFCTIPVSFAPTSRGTHVSGLTFTDNALGSPQTVQITGRGLAPVVNMGTQPVLCLNNNGTDPNFQGVVVNTSSPCGTSFTTTDSPTATPLTLKNDGDAPLHISSIIPSSDFTIDPPTYDTACGATLAPQSSCTLRITFAPTVKGIHEGGLRIVNDAADSPQIVPLTATARAPLAQLAPPPLPCPDTIVGGPLSPSTCPSPVLTNLGDAPLHINSIVPSDPFLTATVSRTVVPQCPANPLPTDPCNLPITISFAPTERGQHTSGLTITDDAIGGTQSVQIIAKGLAPVATLSGTSLTCPATVVGQPAATCLVPGTTPAPLTLTNGGDAPLNITSIVAGDNFKVDPAGCPQSLAVGAPACTLNVTFAPTTRGNHVGNLAIADNAPGTPQTVQLAATGLAPIAILNAPTLACLDTIVGQTGTCGTTPLTLTNRGDATLNISSIVASDDFKIAPASCPTTLAPTVNCTLTVTFVPTTRGNHVGNLTIADDAPGSPHTVQLSAKGLAPVATLSAQTMTCPNTAVGATVTCGAGTPGNLQPFTLKNDGDAVLNISSIVASDDFKISAPLTGTFCGSTLAGGATCGMQITFAPTARGTHISSLVIADNAPGSPHSMQLTATALAPVLSLSAPTLTCPPTIVGGTPGTCGSGTPGNLQPFVLTNTGDAILHISGIVPNDPFLKVDVTQADVPPCPAGQPISATCQQTITIAFTPTERGIHTSGLTITDDASGSPRSVPISVQGLAPVATLNTASPLTCADTNAGTAGVVVGASSACGVSVTPTLTPLTLTNGGDAPLTISSIVVGDDFKIAPGQCPPTLAVGAPACTLNVTFAPKAGGNHVSNLVIADNAPGSPQSVQLTGIGLAPTMNLIGLPVTCPSTPVDQTGTCSTFNFTNTGTTALTIRSIVLNGDFIAASNCSTTIQVQPGPAPCVVTVTFGPIAAGIRSGSLTITDDAPDSPQVIALSGTGQVPVLSFGTPPTNNPPTITCPDTAVGATSAPCGTGLILTNSGTAPLAISSIVASDDFKVTAGQCIENLAPTPQANSSCTLQVTFAPTSAGNHVGSVTVTDNAAGSPHSVQLTATGLGPVVTFNSQSVVCNGTPVGTPPIACPALTLTNTGNAPLSVTNIVLDGNFTATIPPSCGNPIAVNTPCQIAIKFGPTAAGNRVGSLTIADNAPGSPQTIALSGTGQSPVVSLTPSSLACPSIGTAVGTPATCGSGFTLTNMGDAPLTISSIVASDDFSVAAGSCVSPLPAAPGPNNSCTLAVTFTPTTPGNHTGTITIVDNAAGSPHTAQVTGTGLAPVVSFDVPSLTCPDTAIGGNNPCPVITLTNTGNAPLKHTSITANSPFSKAADTCATADIQPGSACQITVNFAPSASGNFTGFLTVADNAAGNPHKVPLSGNGIGVPIATMTVAGAFADTTVGQTALTGVTVTIANDTTATGNLTLSLITISSEFGINSGGSTCGTTVTPGASCILAITFTPAADGQRSGSVTITSNAPNSLQTTLPLTGKGLGTPAITIAPTTPLTCPDTLVGTPASCLTHVTITNSGTAQLTLSQIALTGDYALDALTNSTCGSNVAPGSSCALAISFTPTATGVRPGSLTITDSAPGSPHQVQLTGKGIQPGLTPPTPITCPATVVATTVTCSTTLTNPGTAPLTLNPSITGGSSDFRLGTGANACTASLAANNGTCTLYVDFTPTATGPRTGMVSLGDNAPGSPHTVALSGTGTQPAATLSTASITCADTVTNGTGTCQQVTVTNSGTGPLTFTAKNASGAFAVDTTLTTCNATLAVNTSCTVAAFFKPLGTGPATGTLTITDNASPSTQTASLTGNGVAAASTLTIGPSAVTCGTVAKGSPNPCSTMTLTNTSTTTAITITSKTAAPTTEFAISSTTCTSSLAANTSCTLAVTFTPAEADLRNGTVTIVYDPGTGPRTAVIPYSGTGT